jgi:membrane AbrB-like protein
MAAAILVAAAQGSVRVPHWPFVTAQGVVGCMIARSITPSTIGAMLHDWPLFLTTTTGVLAAGALLGWLLARWRVLPGTTAVWGSCPGAATTMVLMAEAYGADIRLVAFMQYLRVVFVALAATVVAGIWTTASGGQIANVLWFPPIQWAPFVETLALAGLAPIVAHHLRIPAGPLLLPLALGAVLHGSGVMAIELPPWLLAVSYALLGWSIGLRFTRPILAHAARALPRVAASILALIAFCGVLALLLTWIAGIDPLTAYLATSPGGADTVAIIAASTKVDVPFVMAMQTARFLIILLFGPSLARLIARRTGVAEEIE